MQLIEAQELNVPDPVDYLYTLMEAYLNFIEREGNEGMEKLNDEQHTLLAYCYLDSQVQEGGFVQLIAAGYGEYIFMNPVADSLRRWRIKPTPKILDKARVLYQKYGAQIEELAEEGADLVNLRAKFNEFEELDGDYYEAADEDLLAASEYVKAHLEKFIAVN